MGRYQCHQCYREFSRSDSLRRHKDSGVCKEAQTNMSDSDEESVASAGGILLMEEIYFENMILMSP